MKKIFSLLCATLYFVNPLSSAEEKKGSGKEIAAADNIGPNAGGFPADTQFGPETEDMVDPRVLRDFIESRGLIECRGKEGNLVIAGDTRARFSTAGETVNDINQRGFQADGSVNSFKSELNIFLDYTAPNTWMTSKVRWSVFDGVDGGTAVKVDLDRAFIGYDIFEEGKEDFYIELGRTKLDYIFESRIEFGSTFDGIHLYYTTPLANKLGTFFIHGGPFVVDAYANHFAWGVEAAVVNFCDKGVTLKYSLIDWYRHAPTLNYGKNKGVTAIIDNPRYRFIVSQMLYGYERKLDWVGCKSFFLYGAILANHDAKRSRASDYKKLNGAWYVGFTLGKLCKGGDWSIDVNFQSVQAQAVPEFDLTGIGHGNAAGTFFSDAVFENTDPFLARGFTNYKGLEASALYAMTDSLSLRTRAQYSTPRNKSVGGDFFYKSFEMSVIYAF